MPIGYSLHIGLNKVNNLSYSRKVSLLNSCHNDAIAYLRIASEMGFHQSKILLDECATSGNFFREVELISDRMQSGDFFLLTFSGHGSQKRSEAPQGEDDKEEETWCFYDGEVLDNHLYEVWHRFKESNRILVVSDSCHSGTILRDIFDTDPFATKVSKPTEGAVLSRGFNDDPFTSPVAAHVKLLAAAREDRYAQNQGAHGMFTTALLKIWSNGTFQGNYQDFFEAISGELPRKYPPARMDIGRIDSDFNLQKPFQI